MPRNSTNIQNLKILQVNLGRAKIARDIVQPTASATGLTKLETVIAGDFNAKAPMWGSPVTDARGEYLMKWAAEMSRSVINAGNTPTFERGTSMSFLGGNEP
ncbi:Endonuclease-reverse transcriptase [Popillia japonica]|uniref:Endonuclease-reverse transcriptase n=1 Tax=Popillia japonica TaxID=7064 RepID=A0AAW1ITM3_POPJA